MGDSLVRTNGQLLKDLAADMLLITYADIVFAETTLRVVRSVGWTLKEARGPAFTFGGGCCMHLASVGLLLPAHAPPIDALSCVEVRSYSAPHALAWARKAQHVGCCSTHAEPLCSCAQVPRVRPPASTIHMYKVSTSGPNHR